MKYLVFTSITCFGLLACSENGSTQAVGSSGNNVVSGSQAMDLSYGGVDQIVLGGNDSIYMLDTDCGIGGAVVQDTSNAYVYSVADGKLYLLGEDKCKARVLYGSNSGIEGTWAFHGEFASFPGANIDSTYCDGVDIEEGKVEGTFQISSTQIQASLTRKDFCWADLSAHADPESADTMVAVGCDSLLWKRQGAQATLKLMQFQVSSTGGGNETSFRFQYNGKTCNRHRMPYNMPNAETCAVAWNIYQTDSVQHAGFYYWDYSEVYEVDSEDEQQYEACVIESGFPESIVEPGM